MMKSSSTNAPESRPFTLAGATIEPLLNLISRDGQHFQVERQVMLLLLFLVENIDQVVTRESLLESLWENSVPKDEALTQAVSKLRKALGDSPTNGRLIQTIRKVGYRLTGPVSYAHESNLVKEAKSPFWQQSRKTWAGAIAITLFGIASLLNNVTIRTGDYSDANHSQQAKAVRILISRNHEQLPADMDNQIDQSNQIDQDDTGTIEQLKIADQP